MTENMLILALESSAKPASVAICDGSRLLGQYYQNSGYSHSRTLMPMTESLLGNLNIKPGDIDLFAVANGPGSFTGVRIGVSAAKGLAFGLDKPVCGVSTLEAMAYQCCPPDAGCDSAGRQCGCGLENILICPVMDARRSQVYNAVFRCADGRPLRIRDDRAISISDLISDLESLNQPFMPVGDGTDLLLSAVKDSRKLTAACPYPLLKYQSAYGVALAAIHTQPLPAVRLEPVYLRPSQAEREKKASQK